MPHTITVGPSSANLVDSHGRVSALPKARPGTHRARCSCGWRSQERSTGEQAAVDGEAHVRLIARPHEDLELPTMIGEPEPLT